MAEANPMMKQVLSDPEMMKSMLNPESMKQAFSMMGGAPGGSPFGGMGMPPMGGMPGMMGGFPPMGMPGMGMPGMGMPGMGMPGMGGFPPMGGMMGMNPMMAGMMGAGNPLNSAFKPAVSNPNSTDPKEKYANEIQVLKAMGVPNEEVIIKALEENNGDLDKTMESLFGALDYGDEDDQA
jgi:hypothetical protein